MPSCAGKSLLIFVLSGSFLAESFAQTMPGKPAVLLPVEPGLENAVKWKWHVEASDVKDWGFALPEPASTPTIAASPSPESRPTQYEVKHGDALILLGKRFGVTVAQIKTFNGLKNDTIRVGQALKIPTAAEVRALPSPSPSPVKNPAHARKHKKGDSAEPKPEDEFGLDQVRLQVLLDREEFSAGPIAAAPESNFARVLLLYQSVHDDSKDEGSLMAKAKTVVPDVFTHYTLKTKDFRFIAPPRAEIPAIKKPQKQAHKGKAVPHPPANAQSRPTYDQMISVSMLGYRSAWEFVAERFHCQQSYLRYLNDKLPNYPIAGANFRVPNVIPFEIEKAFDEPLQPQPDPKNTVTVAAVGLSQLNIYQNGVLVSVMPMSPARPGLHGRGSWTILDTIPRPRLATLQEPRMQNVPKLNSPGFRASPGLGSNTGLSPGPGLDLSPGPSPSASPPAPALNSEQYLPAGPRNPVGILWINLAKSNSSEPLPYGLHGTSIPDQMTAEQSIGGFRLTNWDIIRAAHHLPPGTFLEWK